MYHIWSMYDFREFCVPHARCPPRPGMDQLATGDWNGWVRRSLRRYLHMFQWCDARLSLVEPTDEYEKTGCMTAFFQNYWKRLSCPPRNHASIMRSTSSQSHSVSKITFYDFLSSTMYDRCMISGRWGTLYYGFGRRRMMWYRCIRSNCRLPVDTKQEGQIRVLRHLQTTCRLLLE